MRVVVGKVVKSYPAEEDAAKALFCEDAAPCLEVRLVNARVDLTTAFDEIERGDCGVSRTAGCRTVMLAGVQARCSCG
jgi:hypothetical protein